MNEENEIPLPDAATYQAMCAQGVTLQERERMIRSVVSNEALSGITVSLAFTAYVFDKVFSEPLPEIGADEHSNA